MEIYHICKHTLNPKLCFYEAWTFAFFLLYIPFSVGACKIRTISKSLLFMLMSRGSILHTTLPLQDLKNTNIKTQSSVKKRPPVNFLTVGQFSTAGRFSQVACTTGHRSSIQFAALHADKPYKLICDGR